MATNYDQLPDDELLVGLDGTEISLAQLSTALRALSSGSGEATAVEIVCDIVQPGAHSGILKLSLADGAERLLFLKKVTAASMAHKAWADRRRTLAYARTEARFYGEFVADAHVAERLARCGVRVPQVGLSDNRLDGVLGCAVDQPNRR